MGFSSRRSSSRRIFHKLIQEIVHKTDVSQLVYSLLGTSLDKTRVTEDKQHCCRRTEQNCNHCSKLQSSWLSRLQCCVVDISLHRKSCDLIINFDFFLPIWQSSYKTKTSTFWIAPTEHWVIRNYPWRAQFNN